VGQTATVFAVEPTVPRGQYGPVWRIVQRRGNSWQFNTASILDWTYPRPSFRWKNNLGPAGCGGAGPRQRTHM